MPFALRRTVGPVALVLAAIAGRATTAAAQAAVNPISFGISGGAVVPVGDFGDSFDTGFGVNGLIMVRVPTSPLSFRGEVGYARNSVKNFSDLRLQNISGVGNLVFNLSAGPTSTVQPYLIGGVGVYNLKFDVAGIDDGEEDLDDDSETKLGLNGGVGVTLPLSGISVFGEVRFTSVFTEGSRLNYVPITVGIRF